MLSKGPVDPIKVSFVSRVLLSGIVGSLGFTFIEVSPLLSGTSDIVCGIGDGVSEFVTLGTPMCSSIFSLDLPDPVVENCRFITLHLKSKHLKILKLVGTANVNVTW